MIKDFILLRTQNRERHTTLNFSPRHTSCTPLDRSGPIETRRPFYACRTDRIDIQRYNCLEQLGPRERERDGGARRSRVAHVQRAEAQAAAVPPPAAPPPRRLEALLGLLPALPGGQALARGVPRAGRGAARAGQAPAQQVRGGAAEHCLPGRGRAAEPAAALGAGDTGPQRGGRRAGAGGGRAQPHWLERSAAADYQGGGRETRSVAAADNNAEEAGECSAKRWVMNVLEQGGDQSGSFVANCPLYFGEESLRRPIAPDRRRQRQDAGRSYFISSYVLRSLAPTALQHNSAGHSGRDTNAFSKASMAFTLSDSKTYRQAVQAAVPGA
ncbi:hypothetical protein ON010_g3142 [Phytophthora cinnamomi]|nr:hypothetical protein ON010_g3142 [Phytophthora cinnamomi]